jgi:ParB-like chromosome segregation protein Spo0J
MTVLMVSDPVFELAEANAEAAAAANAEAGAAANAEAGTGITSNGNVDPMSLVEQLPEVLLPVEALALGYHLRQEGTDAAHVQILADAAESVQLPSILVQKRGLRVIDGMHRVEVAKLRDEWYVKARVIDCTDEEAVVLAVKCNALHGLPLSRADRIASGKRILAAHLDWSDRAIAEITGLSAKTIASMRARTGTTSLAGKRLGRDGKRRPVLPAEGRRRAAEYIKAHPEASLREVAREADVSLGTAHDVKDKIRRGSDPAVARVSELPADRPARTSAAAMGHSPASLRAMQPASASARGPQVPWPAMSVKLASDPALRYTDGGRAFLRWMAGHAMRPEEWQQVVDAVPAHWLQEVSRLAFGMSEEWRQFAERLGNKLEAASLKAV